MCFSSAQTPPGVIKVTSVNDDVERVTQGPTLDSESTYGRLMDSMHVGRGHLTRSEVAALADVAPEWVDQYWRALGFADVSAEEKAFTREDATAMRRMREQVDSGAISAEAAMSLTRAQGHGMDRLVLWQVEALVDDAIRRFELDDASARLVVLDRIQGMYELLEDQLIYTWRRQLAALLGRIDRELATIRDHSPSPEVLPLARAVGLVDMVNFTSQVRDLAAHELGDLVGSFENRARDVVAQYGARVVKTIGDAVLFVADSIEVGAQVSLAMIDAMDAARMPVRGSLVWGRVLSRSGDIFGPTVNLASRLNDVARPGEIMTDDETAELLERHGFGLKVLEPTKVQSLGTVHPVRLLPRD